jgi:hypothetical protein
VLAPGGTAGVDKLLSASLSTLLSLPSCCSACFGISSCELSAAAGVPGAGVSSPLLDGFLQTGGFARGTAALLCAGLGSSGPKVLLICL